MIDHVAIKVRDIKKSRAFYENAFAPLGYTVVFDDEGFCAFAIGDGLFELWEYTDTPITTTHVAFRAKEKEDVDAFYQAALAAGGRDNGAPGPRPQYTKYYYACFILDPDGHNIEVMHDR